MERQRQWYEKNYSDREYTYTPYEGLDKETQEIEMVVTYKIHLPEQGDQEKKCDYSETIKKIMKRQEKLFAKG